MAQNIRPAVRKFARLFKDMRDSKANESDTVARLRHFFEETLGYDDITDISSEAEMKGKYVDLCLKINGNICMLVEVKAAAIELRVRQIDQAKHYAAENGFRWVLLTNGVDWNLYHVTFNEDEGIEYDPAFIVSLADEKLDKAVENLGLLHKRAISKGSLEKFWERKSALCAGSIGKALFHENVLKVLRREIYRLCEVRIDPEDLAQATHNMLSLEAREEVGPLRIRKTRRVSTKGSATKKSKPVTKTVTDKQPPIASPTKP